MILKDTNTMMTFISCAKTMTGESTISVPFTSAPQYMHNAQVLAERMAAYSTEELMDILKISRAIANESNDRYKNIIRREAEMTPSLFAYSGMVFKHIAPETFSPEDLEYAHRHLRITSFLYGLLKPLDVIASYRLEGGVRICRNSGKTIFKYWHEILTGDFIGEIKEDGGTLINLASMEMKDLFDWKRIESSVNVIQPEFMIQGKNGKTRIVTVYAKMCRGEMTRHIIMNRIDKPEGLKSFEWEGFKYSPEHSSDTSYAFIKQAIK